MTPQTPQLMALLEKLCEGLLTEDETRQLERLVQSNRDALQIYLEYVDLHGTLYWDTAHGLETDYVPGRDAQSLRPATASTPVITGVAPTGTLRRNRSLAIVIAVVMSAVAVLLVDRDPAPVTPNTNFAEQAPPPLPEIEPAPKRPSGRVVLQALNSSQPRQQTSDSTSRSKQSGTPLVAAPQTSDGIVQQPQPTSPQPQIVSFIDHRLQLGWKAQNIAPSPRAKDTEWVRRVFLDIVGHIPTAAQVQSFVTDRRPDKRNRMISVLLDDADYVRNFTTIWSNLLVGRSPNADVSKRALQRFLRDGFRRNRPWKDLVYDLVAAEGTAESNGATNFLLAHLNNQAVPATAITAQLFMGCQIQCTQCHKHPFNNTTQAEFWELNSFFKQTVRTEHFDRDPNSGQRLRTVELVSQAVGGPTFFETRRGRMQVSRPRFEGTRIPDDKNVNRRRELGRLMTSGAKTRVAEAIVNRMWQHFLGHAFTASVTDMGPHVPVSHPEILDRLAREFVRSNYDLKQLARWICNSNAYSLTSEFSPTNQIDDPSVGNPPLFSRTYLKQMSAEQLYDSLAIATQAAHNFDDPRLTALDDRSGWIQQFVFDHDTDENDEFTSFSGTISQALLMMNGEMIERAIGNRGGTFLQYVVSQPKSDREKIRMLCLSALSRYPTQNEQVAFRSFMRPTRASARKNASVGGFQDIFWAYLNSSEFILIH
ncbi:MAG: DUF1549 domain-containing protein [Planctomycetaceae bacterium]